MGKKNANTAVPAQVKHVNKVKENAFLYDWKRNRNLLLMSLIGVVVVFIFNYMPMGGIIIAFKDYNLFKGIMASPWAGLKHFRSFFGDPYFGRLLRNTFLTGFWTFIFTFPAPIVLALMLNELKDGMYKKVTQTITYLPYFISAVVVVSLMKTMFSVTGPVNHVIQAMGGDAIMFFNEPGWFRPLYVGSSVWQTVGYNSIIYLAALSGVDPSLYEAATLDGATKMQKIINVTLLGSSVWQTVGYNSIIYLAALSGVDPSLYEAATLDGATKMQKIINVTLPAISGTILVLLIMNIGSVVSVGFEKVFLMYNPGTYETADVLSTYTYRRGIKDREYSFGATVDLFNSVISMTLLIIANTISKKIAGEGLW